MKRILFHPILVILISFITCIEGNTCTTFCIRDSNNLVLGKNFDFYTGIGQVSINKRNLRKSSFNIPPERPLEWTSKYGSITFNQMGREFPYGGINEKGLVIELMWLTETDYPELDDRYGLSELQWIQYQLDHSASVDDVLASDAIIRISRIATAPVHFLVCDSKGNMATIEYLDGKMIYHTKSTLPICVLANDAYDKSINYVNSLTDLEEHCKNSFTSGSLNRFAKAALMIQDFGNQDIINYSFDILGAVHQGDFTRWSIVYDIKNMTVYYKTLNNRETRLLQIADFDFSCHSPSVYIDIDKNTTNDTLSFQPYSYPKNRKILDQVFAILFEKAEFRHLVPNEAERELISRYPESTECDE